MALKWTQEPRYSAKGTAGKYYKVFPFSNLPQFAATVTYLDDNGNVTTLPLGGQYDSFQEAQDACERDYAKIGGK